MKLPAWSRRRHVLLGSSAVLLVVAAGVVVINGGAEAPRAERERAFLLAVRSGENPNPTLRRAATAELISLGDDACDVLAAERSIPAAAGRITATGLSFDAAVFLTVAANRSLCQSPL